MKKIAVIYARLVNQFIFEYQTVFSAWFEKPNEDDQVLHEIDLSKNLKNNQNLTESDMENTDVRSQLGQQFQNQESKDGGWRFDKVNWMTM